MSKNHAPAIPCGVTLGATVWRAKIFGFSRDRPRAARAPPDPPLEGAAEPEPGPRLKKKALRLPFSRGRRNARVAIFALQHEERND
ncbi:unnamed protein product [Amoebophrya sp. A120]|nr:unnamed protein product [Amoebophrya sp. A120]|eukprot:GSA120T00008698001.1